jgi:hypothetical protein
MFQLAIHPQNKFINLSGYQTLNSGKDFIKRSKK